jgi:ATP-dependent RNA helicase SUPV3L1/SUV3
VKSSSLDSPDARPTPPAFPLPQPLHAARFPAGLAPEDWARIRQAAHALPQVLVPADLDGGSDESLDRLGCIQISRAAGGGRPSRWILPQHIAVALAQLDATPLTNTLRPQLQQRMAQLESLGLRREGLVFTRLCVHPIVLAHEAWRIDLSHRVPVPEEPIWAFFRDGDAAALRHALGQAPAYSYTAELTLHLNHLLARSEAMGHASQLASLLPRLQAECGVPMPYEDLKAALTRAQDRWEQRVTELVALEGLTHDLAFQRYPDSFEAARAAQRQVTLYVGPPNSGKTHAAFERLAQAHDGAYLAPLRLLALEGRDRLVARGVPCSLLTGEENVPAADARVVSSTIEMVGTDKPIDVAVIDEAQMIFDGSRGWAWTQAIVGVPANELIIICSDYAVPAIEGLLGLCGERCTVRVFERKQHVELLPRPVSIDSLQLGDAVVAFSRRDVLMLRDRISAGGHPVSVIYGALPPEVRRREAERFAQGESHILVATDAIGMGLNLPIRRVLFSTMSKFDGEGDRPLGESEVHQIAGRAGRFGLHEEGFAGVLDTAEPSAARQLRELLHKRPQVPHDFKAPVAPNPWHVKTISARLHKTKLREVLGVFVEQLRLDDAHFAVAELDQMLLLAEALDKSAAKLPLKQRFTYAQAPVDTRTESQLQEFLDWSARHALTGQAGKPWFLDAVDGHSRLDRMEQALRGCTLWLWLDLRFPGIYGHVEEVHALRAALNDGIERQLKGKRPLAQVRMGRRSAGPRA